MITTAKDFILSSHFVFFNDCYDTPRFLDTSNCQLRPTCCPRQAMPGYCSTQIPAVEHLTG